MLVQSARRGKPRGLDQVNHWAGQNAAMAAEEPAGEIVARMWRDTTKLLG